MTTSTAPTDHTVLWAALEQRLPATLAFLEEIVGINSFSRNAEGVTENARRIAQQFAPLGFIPHFVPCTLPGTGHHLVLDSGGSGPAIALISHLDTVYPPEEETRNEFRWLPEGDRIYGPGTIDIKGGTVLIWMVLATLAEVEPELFRSTRWFVLSDAVEEILPPHFRDVCLQYLPESTRACLIFEPGARNDDDSAFSLTSARKGFGEFRVNVTGRAAHSGNAYAQGANAVHQVARVIDRLVTFTDLERETTLNVGAVSGGTVTNRVPHEAEALLEMRYFNEEHYAEVRAQVLGMTGPGDVVAPGDGYPCQINVTVDQEIPAWPENEETRQLLTVWQKAGEAMGHRVEATPRGGISDGNWFSQHFPTLDGLGPTGGNAHASERSADGSKIPEHIFPATIVPKALLNCLAIRELLSHNT
jgi:glutamate carboxypeptidase